MFEAAALTLLAEAGRVLGESLDLSATFAGVARLCVSGLAELAIFDLVDGEVRRVAVAAANPDLAPLAEELRGYPPRDWTRRRRIRTIAAPITRCWALLTAT